MSGQPFLSLVFSAGYLSSEKGRSDQVVVGLGYGLPNRAKILKQCTRGIQGLTPVKLLFDQLGVKTYRVIPNNFIVKQNRHTHPPMIFFACAHRVSSFSAFPYNIQELYTLVRLLQRNTNKCLAKGRYTVYKGTTLSFTKDSERSFRGHLGVVVFFLNHLKLTRH